MAGAGDGGGGVLEPAGRVMSASKPAMTAMLASASSATTNFCLRVIGQSVAQVRSVRNTCKPVGFSLGGKVC